MKNQQPRTVAFSLLVVGATFVSSQIILIREFFTSFYGNELSVGFIMAIWLLGGAIGSGLLGGIFADKLGDKKIETGRPPGHHDRGHPYFHFSLIQLLLALLVPLGILSVRVSGRISGIKVGEIVGLPAFLASAGLTILPITITLGFLFVLGCRLLPDDRKAAGIARAYTLEAFGALAGGTFTAIILIRYLGSLEIAAILMMLNLMSSYLILGRSSLLRDKALKTVLVGSVIIIVAFLSCGGLRYLDKRSLDLKWSGFEVLKNKNTIYGRITAAKRSGQLNIFDNGLLFLCSHDPLTAEEVAHFPLSFSEHPLRVLLIGGGGGEIMAEILKHPVGAVDYVELNPALVSFQEEFLGEEPFYSLRDKRVRIVTGDARIFIKEISYKYDAIIVNLPNPYTAKLNRFYTAEFFRDARKVLSPDGVLGFSVSSSENYLSNEQSRFLKSLRITAESEFDEVKIIPGNTAHFILSNKKDSIVPESGAIASALLDRKINTYYVRDYYLTSRLSSDRMEYLESAMKESGASAVNRDFYPISYFYDMVLWSSHFYPALSRTLMLLTRERLIIVLAFLTFLIFAIYYIKRRGKHFKESVTILALGTTGLSEIAFQILIVLAFQIIYGYLYYKIGIIITAFMLGLSIGSLYITKRLDNIRDPFKYYIKVQAMVLAYPLLLLAAFKAFSHLSSNPTLGGASSHLFAILPFIAGFVGGLQYPLANKICSRKDRGVGRIAGITYAVDMFGSFLGAILISTLLVPILGIPITCVAVVVLNGVSFVLLLVARRC
ncbi:MAG: hypothetical protein ABID09_05605 [Candidatus Omnitrophota bacterium]